MKQTEVLTVGAEHPRTGPWRRARLAVAVVLTGALLAAAFLAVNRHDRPPPSAGPSSGVSTGLPSVVATSEVATTEVAISGVATSGAGTKSLAGQPPGLLIRGADGGSVLDR